MPETLHALGRGAPRRPERRRAARRPGRSRARQDVHEAGLATLGGREPRRSSSPLLAALRPQGDRSRSRPTRARRSAASTPSCRTSSSRSRTRRSRRSRAQDQAPRGGAVPLVRRGAQRRTRSSRSIASHYLDAYRAAPTTADAGEIRDDGARAARAGRGAGGVARGERARRSARSSGRVELTDDRCVQAELHERAGMLAREPALPGRTTRQRTTSRRSSSSRRRARPIRPRRVSARLAEVMWDRGRLERGSRQSMERAFDGPLARTNRTRTSPSLAAQLGRLHVLRRRHGNARAATDRDGARARGGAGAPRGLLAGAEHEGDHAGRRADGSVEALALLALRTRGRARATTSRRRRFARTTTSRTRSVTPTATRRP